MYSFEGDFRRKPLQSLRGASKKEEKDSLIKRTQTERQKREEIRHQNESALKIQAFIRGSLVRKKKAKDIRAEFDHVSKSLQKADHVGVDVLNKLITQLCYMYNKNFDGQRLVWVCQIIIRQREEYIDSLANSYTSAIHQVSNLLLLSLQYLATISNTSAPIAVPMRMLEVFTSPATYRSVSSAIDKPQHEIVVTVLSFLVKNGYYDIMRALLHEKVPSSLERTTIPPTPAAASVYELIMNPIGFAASSSNKSFSNMVLKAVCQTLLCPTYTEQISQFLLPAMAYGKYPFPFVELIQALITNTSSKSQKSSRRKEQQNLHHSPWLLAAILTFGETYLEKLNDRDIIDYIKVLQNLIPFLPEPKFGEYADDSESEEDMITDSSLGGLTTLSDVREECLRLLDSQNLVKCIVQTLSKDANPDTLTAVARICHCLLCHQKVSVHRVRLLYSLAFNTKVVREMWYTCIGESLPTVTGSQTPLIHMLARGLPLSENEINRIVPLLSVFCSMFSHSLLTLHDADFHGDEKGISTSMPFSLEELVPMGLALRDVCLGIIELAHPDSKPAVNEDYRIALQSTGVINRKQKKEEELKQTHLWAYLFKVTASLVRQLQLRDSRRQYCPNGHWLAQHVHINADQPSQIYRAQNAVFVRRSFGALPKLTRFHLVDDEGPPLSNRDVRNLVILTELPFVVSFADRVKILQKLILNDKEEHQSDTSQFMSGESINVMIRRNYIYEDAFEKLSTENEPSLKKRMRVQLTNMAGLDEAGIDGGGIFREFLSELLKTGFDPNRGFFIITNDRLLYPNPQAQALVGNYLQHYFFLGRMVGKAVYENLLVELPFADFFLSKILSRHSGDLDIHHLASLDPEMYKNLLFLKTYEGDVSQLELDFTVVSSEFGETKVEELKPGGKNIPVTSNNIIEYIHLMADYKLNKKIRAHCAAFRNGMSDVINLEWLRMFSHHELQVLISGASVPVDVEDLRKHTNYSGIYTAEHPVISSFWNVVSTLTDKQRGQLLKFVTSCSRPPLLGFKDLYPPFCIHYAGNEADRLPTASTCMNLLKLPEFRDEQTLRNKLLYAIESGSGFELS